MRRDGQCSDEKDRRAGESVRGEERCRAAGEKTRCTALEERRRSRVKKHDAGKNRFVQIYKFTLEEAVKTEKDTAHHRLFHALRRRRKAQMLAFR